MFRLKDRRKSPPKRRWLRGCVLGFCILLLIILVARNKIVRFAVERIGTSVVGANVRLGEIHIGLSEITLSRLYVADRGSPTEPQLTLERISLKPTIWQGIKRGKWLSTVTATKPVAHIRFAADGSLISKFPESSSSSDSGEIEIPLDSLVVDSAELVIHQVGKEPLRISQVSLKGFFHSEIHLQVEVPDLVGAKLQIDSQLNAKTFSGKTKLSCAGMRIDTKELSGLPLIPETLAMQAIKTDVDVWLHISHPANNFDLRHHDMRLRAKMSAVQSEIGGELVNGGQLFVENKSGKLNLRGSCLPISGELTLTGEADLLAETIHTKLVSTGRKLQLNRLSDFVPEGPAWQAVSDFDVEVNGSWDGEQIQFTSSAQNRLDQIVVDGIPIKCVTSNVNVAGSLQTGLSTILRGMIKADVSSVGVDLADISERFQSEPLNGQVSIFAEASVPLDTITDPNTFAANFDVALSNLEAMGNQLSDTVVRGSLQHGQLQIPRTRIGWRNAVCEFQASGEPFSKPQIKTRFAISNLLLREIADVASQYAKTPLPLVGMAEINGTLDVSTEPLAWFAKGDANLSNSAYAGTEIGNAKFNWDADLSGLRVHSNSNDFLGGDYEVTASMKETDWTKTILHGKFGNLRVPRLIAFTNMELPSTGVVHGGFEVTSIENLETLLGRVWMTTQGASIHRAPLEITTAEIKVKHGLIQAGITGKFCGGTIASEASTSTKHMLEFLKAEGTRFEQLPLVCEGRLDGARVEDFVSAAGMRPQQLPVSGLISARITRDKAVMASDLLAKLTISADRIHYHRDKLSDRIAADIDVRSDRIQLTNVSGRFADGTLAGKADIDIQEGLRGSFQLSARNINMRRASAPFIPDVSGNANLTIAGRIAGSVSGQANINVENASASGIMIRQARFPVDWSFSPSSSLARWQCRAGRVEAGGGEIFIASEGSYASALSTRTQIRFDRIDTSKLQRGKSFGLGILSGKVGVNAKRAQSVDQLAGDFDIELKQVKSLEIPVLDQLPQLIKVPTIYNPDSQDDGGYLYGRFGGGLVHLEQLALWQSNVQILAQGTATLAGRIDLDITASTQKNGPADQLLELANSPLLLAAPAPVALLARANDALKDRVIHVQVSGTAENPALRLQPAKQLTQSALQFFIRNSLGSQLATAAANQNRPRPR